MIRIAFLFTTVILNVAGCYKQPCTCDFIQRLAIDVKIVDNSGHDLVSGPSSIYKLDSLHILNSMNDLSVNNASADSSRYQANSIAFTFYIPASKSYIYYGGGIPRDSLDIVWLNKTGECCNTPANYFEVGAVKFNNQTILPQNGVYYFVK